ncbi:Prolyl tripeptidyl peptidase precursor [Aquisphaera giovannonii]|uniref:Prolyl tripeptidyl peptidase n=1 Tax=Aquisphaera giovannonii TaxID=406548 RepID=A0A5B9W869_9BACT|nr:S9 family peptidase [Aquisphaera giovannonii]QEH36339.1 Prolyl tripeptidyl peptidase precursor [Aquisphaera giovannonii]
MPRPPIARLAASLLAAILLHEIPGPPAFAQGTKADYERSASFGQRMAGKVFKARVQAHWFSDGHRFWYRNDLADGAREFVLVDAEKAERKPLFDHAKLAEALQKASGKPQDKAKLTLERVAVLDDLTIHFGADGKTWRFDPKAGTVAEAPMPADSVPSARQGASPSPGQGPGRRSRREGARQPGSRRTEDSPDGKFRTFIRDFDVNLEEKGTGGKSPLSFEGAETDGYEGGVFWSPDSKRFVALRTAKGDTHMVHMVSSSPADQLQPKLISHEYPKPGDRLPVSRPHLFDAAARREIPIDDDHAPNPFSIDDVRWSPDSKRFTFVYNQRGHQSLRVVSVDAASGHAAVLVDEASPTFVDYAHKQFLHFLDAKNELIWMSERSGWNHLYLMDATTGTIKNPITRGEWLVREVERVDEDARQLWLRVRGIHPGQDPYHEHFARVNFDGTGLVVLTEGDGTHEVEHSPDRKYLIDTYSRVDLPPVTELRRAGDGKLVLGLEKADASGLIAAGWKAPERFVAKGRDGKTDIFGIICRPSTFRADRKYPVLEDIYAGPQDAFVPKRFAPTQPGQAMAELGFIVVKIDGMGTNWRSKAFHDVCWKNLADAGFPDRILWMKAAAAKEPAMDLSRVGLYGGSAGGQNALGGLLTHPEFYKAGAADCGCHDNRMDKVWWNELWMGWPLGPHYDEQSNVTMAHKLQGKLLLTVGELDTNVDPASTMQVVNALIKADKDFELVVFPGANHGAGGSPYGRRRLQDFFVKNLLDVEPRAR